MQCIRISFTSTQQALLLLFIGLVVAGGQLHAQSCPPMINELGLNVYTSPPDGNTIPAASRDYFVASVNNAEKKWQQNNSFIAYDKAVRSSARSYTSMLIKQLPVVGGHLAWQYDTYSKQNLADYFQGKYNYNNSEFQSTVQAAVRYQYAKSKRLPTAAETANFLNDMLSNNPEFKNEYYTNYAAKDFDVALINYLNENKSIVHSIQKEVDEQASKLADQDDRIEKNKQWLSQLEKDMNEKWEGHFEHFKGYVIEEFDKMTASITHVAKAQEALSKIVIDHDNRISYMEQQVFQGLPPRQQQAAIQNGAMGTRAWPAQKKKEILEQLDRKIAAQEAANFHQGYSAYSQLALQSLSTFGLLPEEDLKRVSEFVSFSTQATGVFSNAMAGYAGDPMGYVNAASGFLTLLGGSRGGPDPHSEALKQISKQLTQISAKLDNVIENQRIIYEKLDYMHQEMSTSFQHLGEQVRDQQLYTLWNSYLLEDSEKQKHYDPCFNAADQLKDDPLNTYADIIQLFENSPCSKCLTSMDLLGSKIKTINEDGVPSFPSLFLLSDVTVLNIDVADPQIKKNLNEFKINYFDPSVALFRSNSRNTFENKGVFSLLYPPKYTDGHAEIRNAIRTDSSFGDRSFVPKAYHQFVNTNWLVNAKMIHFYASILSKDQLHLPYYLSKYEVGQRVAISIDDVTTIDFKEKNKAISKMLKSFLFLTDIAISQQSLVAGNQTLPLAYAYLYYGNDEESKSLAHNALRNNVYLQNNLASFHLNSNLRFSNDTVLYGLYEKCYFSQKEDTASLDLLNAIVGHPHFQLQQQKGPDDTWHLQVVIPEKADSLHFLAPHPQLVFSGEMVYPDLLFELIDKRAALSAILKEYELTTALFKDAADPNIPLTETTLIQLFSIKRTP
jgi:hypothetical protein